MDRKGRQMNTKFQNALNKTPQAVPPIWFMRQAGRYHSHYQGLRQKHSFMQLCKQPELASEVALGPIEEFDFDVSILFSDLLFPLEALGMGLEYKPGPVLGWHLDSSNLTKLKPWEEALPALEFQKTAALATRELLPKDKSLIGFVGGPWTLFSYAVEGSHKDGLKKTKHNISLFPAFCEIMIPLLQANIELQLSAGCEVVMVFDTSAGELSASDYQTYVLPQILKLAQKFPKKLGYYTKGTVEAHYSKELYEAPWAGLGFDHRWDLSKQLCLETQPGFVQGNFDQYFLFQNTDDFKKSLENYLNTFKRLSLEERKAWVCGLGHGVLPETPQEHVKYFVNRVREVFNG